MKRPMSSDIRTQLEALLGAADQATPRPWKTDVWHGAGDGGWRATGPHHECADDEGSDEPGSSPHKAAERDARYIALAANLAPALARFAVAVAPWVFDEEKEIDGDDLLRVQDEMRKALATLERELKEMEMPVWWLSKDEREELGRQALQYKEGETGYTTQRVIRKLLSMVESLEESLYIAMEGDYQGFDPSGPHSPLYHRCEAMRAERDHLREQLKVAVGELYRQANNWGDKYSAQRAMERLRDLGVGSTRGGVGGE